MTKTWFTVRVESTVPGYDVDFEQLRDALEDALKKSALPAVIDNDVEINDFSVEKIRYRDVVETVFDEDEEDFVEEVTHIMRNGDSIPF